jgi:hypothetical protein
MKTFLVYYFKEVSDECRDYELEIQGDNIANALENFYKLNLVIKRVFKIEEI